VTDFIIRSMQWVTNRSLKRRLSAGFTLIELMAVVVVIAILALIALPAYTEYVRKSRRAEALTLLNRIAQEQERFRANCATYATQASAPTASGANQCVVALSGLGIPDSASTYYRVNSMSSPASAGFYSATLSTTGPQMSDAKCATFTLTMSGGNLQYASTGTAASSVCWSR
jgi:type IV pilus assembly protein PilE